MTKKVLHIIDTLGLGGAQTVVKGILEGKSSNRNFLYVLRKTSVSKQIDSDDIFICDSDSKFSFSPIFEIKDFIQKNDIQILHCHLARSQVFGFIIKRFFCPEIKLVLHEHGEIFEDGKVYPFLMNMFRNEVDLFLAVSNATKNKILQKTQYPEDKIKILYNFVDLKKFKKIEKFDIVSERKKYGFDKDDFVLGFGARFIKRKGRQEFVNSANILKNKGFNFKFLMAGDGENQKEIEDFIQKNDLQENIKLIGYVDDMVIFYNTLDCLVFPSQREPLGLTGIEANACGCPVIACNIEGLNEIMIDGYNALLFKSKNSDDLTSKIIQLHQDEDLKNSLIKNGYEQSKNCSLKNYLYHLDEIYEKL